MCYCCLGFFRAETINGALNIISGCFPFFNSSIFWNTVRLIIIYPTSIKLNGLYCYLLLFGYFLILTKFQFIWKAQVLREGL